MSLYVEVHLKMHLFVYIVNSSSVGDIHLSIKVCECILYVYSFPLFFQFAIFSELPQSEKTIQIIFFQV